MKMNDILHMVRLYILYILIMLSVMFVSCQHVRYRGVQVKA